MEESCTLQFPGNVSSYRIAGMNVAIAGAEILRTLGKDYILQDGTEVDIAFDVSPDAQVLQEKNQLVSWDKCCYIASGRRFYTHLLPFGGFALHASAVVLDDRAYLFSADSGTGKSTHTSLWCSHFGRDQAYILNDDKPVIRKVGNQIMAFGTPWSGSSGINKNASAPIAGIAFIEQSPLDWIRPAAPGEALRQLLRQADPTLRPGGIGKLLSLLEDLIQNIPIYIMGCTINNSAVLMAYNTMKNRTGEPVCTSLA